MNRRIFVAEALGTALLVAVVIGSAFMAHALGAEAGLLLLANAMATVGALFVLITILGPVSGAQMNPMVSLVMAWRGRIGWGAVPGYLVAQALGALAGMLLAHAMFALPLWQVSGNDRGGAAKMLAEGVASFGLVLVIFGGLAGRANVAALVAAYIGAAYWFTSSTSFANPAMLLARMLSDTPAGIRPMDAPGFLVAQLLGGFAAAGVSAWLFEPPQGS